MKWFNFLTSKAGKIVLGTGQLMAVSAVVGIGFTTLMHNASSKVADERLAARSLSGISNDYRYDGLQQRKGLLTSINVGGGESLATAEEIAAREGRVDFGASTADDAEANLSYSIGNAAQFNQTEGFGQDKDVDVSMPQVRAAASNGANPAASGFYGAANTSSASAQAGAVAADRPQLASASMARSTASGGTSGNVFSTASGAAGGAASAGKASSTGASAEGYKLSGAMPNGSSSMGLGGATSSGSSFIAGGRKGTVGKGSKNNRDRQELKDIAKLSASAAKNTEGPANKGSQAFLASYRNSGGIGVEEETGELETASSDDFSNDNKRKLKAVGDWAKKQDDKAKKQAEARKKLSWMLVGLVLGTMAAIPAIFALISNGRRLAATPATAAGGIAMIVAGFLIMAGILVLAGFLIYEAVKYTKEYQSTALTIISYILSGVAAGSLAYTVAKAFAADITGDKVEMFKFGTAATKGLVSVGISTGTNMLQGEVTKGLSGSGEESANS